MQNNKNSGKVTFKSYDQNQRFLLPPSIEEMIPEDHLVRVVNHVIDQIDLDVLEQAYPGGGASCYHPRMMLKILVYGYCTKTYSCRRIARGLDQNIHFMWLSAMQYPNFRTINNFRTGPLKTLIEDVFSQVLTFLMDHGYIRFENYFVDGTKMRADAYKYSYVWSKSTQRHKQNVETKIQEVIKEIDALNEEEDALYGDQHLEEYGEESQLTSQQVHQQALQINENIYHNYQKGSTSKKTYNKQQTRVKYLQQYGRKLAGYEEQERLLNGRSSYSKTDPDATFMRMKDDQLLPGYNILHGTENQFIINYSIHQNSNENKVFIDHVNQLSPDRKPSTIIGDAIYGSQENYEYLNQHQIKNYLKYPGYYEEFRKRSSRKYIPREKFSYDGQKDQYYCPAGQVLDFTGETTKPSYRGHLQRIREYQSRDCQGCHLAYQCKKGPNPRKVYMSPEYEYYKQQYKENCASEEGKQLRKQRGVDVETPFGNIKRNMRYRRFGLRGLEKVQTEWGIVTIAHNLRKVAAKAS